MTVLDNIDRLLRKSKERRGTAKGVSVGITEKDKGEAPSEGFSIKTLTNSPKTVSGKCEKIISKDTSVLNFQAEPHAPFEQEPTYDVDAFQKTDRTVERLLTPPPNFKKALAQIPQSLQAAFKEILNGELVGIWPIGRDCLRK